MNLHFTFVRGAIYRFYTSKLYFNNVVVIYVNNDNYIHSFYMFYSNLHKIYLIYNFQVKANFAHLWFVSPKLKWPFITHTPSFIFHVSLLIVSKKCMMRIETLPLMVEWMRYSLFADRLAWLLRYTISIYQSQMVKTNHLRNTKT